MAAGRAKTGQRSRFMFTDWLIDSFYKLFIHIGLYAHSGQKRRLPGGRGVGVTRFSGFLGEENGGIIAPRGRLFAGSLRSNRERFGRRFTLGRGFSRPVEIVSQWSVIICKIPRWDRRLQQRRHPRFPNARNRGHPQLNNLPVRSWPPAHSDLCTSSQRVAVSEYRSLRAWRVLYAVCHGTSGNSMEVEVALI
jgi:hypothetical protein